MLRVSNLTSVVTKIIFLLISFAFLIFGLIGDEHEVANFYKSIFFLSAPLTIEFCEYIEANEPVSRATVAYLVMSIFSVVVPLILLFAQNISAVSRHVSENEYWGLALIMLPVFAIPYIAGKCYSPIRTYLKNRNIKYEERQASSG